MPSSRQLQKAILTLLNNERPRAQHKINLLGRSHQQGALEHAFGAAFTVEDRVQADQAFEDLKRNGYIRPTYGDLTDPENWVEITDQGVAFLARDLKDDVDMGLEAIAPHLVELRQGMWDAIGRTSPDAPRQAAHSARELVDQVLKSAPEECKTRKDRFRHLMRQRPGPVSATDIDILEANAELLEAEHNAMLKNAHLRGSPERRDVLASIHAAERILSVLLGKRR